MTKFRLIKILNNNSARKMVCCLGHFTDLSETDEALIIFEKTAFTKTLLGCTDDDDDDANVGSNNDANVSTVKNDCGGGGNGCDNNGSAHAGFFSAATTLREAFVNDIYGNFELFPDPEINSNLNVASDKFKM